MDPVLVQTLLEPIRRRVRTEPGRLADLFDRTPHLVPFCTDLLVDTDQPYTCREEALALLRVPGVPLPAAERRRLRGVSEEDIEQLRLRPTAAARADILDSVRASMQKEYARWPARVDEMPSEVPGLAGLLGVALFSGERVERLGTGAALGALPFAAAVSVALGRALVDDVDACDYGIQRSFLRLLTKIGHPEGHAFFSAFASGQPADEGARLAVAWALGTGSGNDDEAHLAQLASTSTAVTRRVVTLAAQRRGFSAARRATVHRLRPAGVRRGASRTRPPSRGHGRRAGVFMTAAAGLPAHHPAAPRRGVRRPTRAR